MINEPIFQLSKLSSAEMKAFGDWGLVIDNC
jgi:hypothetical protein